MPHVRVDHAVAGVGPHDRVIAAMPDFMRLWTGAQWETSGVDRQEYFDVGI